MELLKRFPDNPFQNFRLTTPKILLIIIALGITAYYNSLFNSFVLDDPSQISGNLAIHSLQNLPQLFLGSTFGGGKDVGGIYYKPLMTTSYALIYSLFGANPLPFHFVQIVLHIGSAILIYLLFHKFFSQIVSFFLALVFLLHPINTEPVVYISNLQDTLYLFFGLLALISISKKKIGLKDNLLYGLFIALSLLSKESGILFLIIGCVLRWITNEFKIKQLLPFALINLIIFIFYFVLRYQAVGLPIHQEAIFPISRLMFIDRLINMPMIFFYYLKTFFYPQDLAIAQHWVVPSIDIDNFYQPLLIDLIFITILVKIGLQLKQKSRESFKLFCFFSTWLFVGIGLHLQFIPLDATVADRWFYFPIIGILGIFGVLLSYLKPKPTKIALLIAVIVLSAMFTRTVVRIWDWKDGLTLALHDIQVTRDSFPLENNLAYELMQVDSYDEALIHAEKSVELAPYWWLNWNNLGVIYRYKMANENLKYLDQAEEAFRKAVDNTDYFYLPYDNLTELLFFYRDPQATIDFVTKASKHIPPSQTMMKYIVISHYKLENRDVALTLAKRLYNLYPQNPQNYALYMAIINKQEITIEAPKY